MVTRELCFQLENFVVLIYSVQIKSELLVIITIIIIIIIIVFLVIDIFTGFYLTYNSNLYNYHCSLFFYYYHFTCYERKKLLL